jgi:hypothetical protein
MDTETPPERDAPALIDLGAASEETLGYASGALEDLPPNFREPPTS